MVRAPAKTCPNLSRLFEEAEPKSLSAFLGGKSLEKFGWLETYQFDPTDPDGPLAASNMLRHENKIRLGPLETEAARIVTIAGDRGEYALDGFARSKLASERASILLNQRDALARSLWAYVSESSLFEAAENSLHLRRYRRYDRHYQTFMAEPSLDGGPDAGSAVLDALLSELNERLDRGDGYSIDKFDIPEDVDEPAAEMFLLFHPDPPTSAREIDEFGNRSIFYFRPPGEAMIVYTPSTGRVHVRARDRKLRHTIAERFIETALNQTYSNQPVDFQAYDIAQFLKGFHLDLPDFQDVVIDRARVIRADISIGNLATRLSVSTTIDQDISEIIDTQPGLAGIFQRAVAIRFVEIAVRYRRAGRDEAQTLDFTLTDRNTSSLLSLDDPYERVLGHRLLRYWKILREGREPSLAESMAVIPALLAAWDTDADRVSGAWLLDRGVDTDLLTKLGFLVPAGWEGDDLIDEADGLGLVEAEVVVRPEGTDLKVTEGHGAPGGNPDRYRVYRVRDGWVAQHLRENVADVLDVRAVEEINKNMLALGAIRIDARDVPVYLVRGLDDDRVRTEIDTELRARSDQGIGLVLQAGNAFGSCLAANVLTRVVDHLEGGSTRIALMADSLRAVFRRNRGLAKGGQVVEFVRSGDNAGTLHVPGSGSIDIVGGNRVRVIERLVNAHNAGPAPMKTEDLTKDMEGQSLANIFKQPLWSKLKDDFVRSRGKGRWEIAA